MTNVRSPDVGAVQCRAVALAAGLTVSQPAVRRCSPWSVLCGEGGDCGDGGPLHISVIHVQ